MKRILSILLVVMMLATIPITALGVSWSAPALSASASPFKAEVIKLEIHSDVTGGEYYTILPDAAAYGLSKIYYAIKLVVPSFRDANAYYGTKDLVSGSKIKVTVDYANIAGKTKEVVYVPLSSEAQTLWYDGVEFSPGWVANLAQYTKSKHILTGTAENTAPATVKVCVASRNTLKDILIDGCYTIEEKDFYGVRTCATCKAVNMNGYLVSGDCGHAAVFIAVNKNKVVTGVYVIDKSDPLSKYEGATVQVDEPLYRWEITGQTDYCDFHGCKHAKYGMTEIFKDSVYSKAGQLAKPATSDGTFAEYCERNKVREELRDFGAAYYVDDDGLYQPVSAAAPWWPTSALCHKDGTAYANVDALAYLDVYYKVDPYEDVLLHKMLSSDMVDCDTIEKAYLNAANYVMGKLGFTYADAMAGKVFMTVDNVLANFGFAVNDCTTARWGAYTAAITVAPIPEVPATGDAPLWVRVLQMLGVI